MSVNISRISINGEALDIVPYGAKYDISSTGPTGMSWLVSLACFEPIFIVCRLEALSTTDSYNITFGMYGPNYIEGGTQSVHTNDSLFYKEWKIWPWVSGNGTVGLQASIDCNSVSKWHVRASLACFQRAQ